MVAVFRHEFVSASGKPYQTLISRPVLSPGKSGRFMQLMQHLLGVYLQESGILRFFLDADSSAARPSRVALE